MKQLRYILLLLFIPLSSFSQYPDIASPVDIPIVLNGNFGEIRGGHFHAGIDIKTKGVTGLPIYSIDKGYVSRIKVSPGGYGLALYLSHPTGFTSVYGHLESFMPKLADWVREQQYKAKSYSVDLFPAQNQFPVEKGEEIGKSGNSGSSAGPHLHFEIRRSSNERPINPLFFNLAVEDKTKPVVEKLYVYPLSKDAHVEKNHEKQIFPLVYYGGKYHLKGMQSLDLFGSIGFGVDAIDYLDNNWSKCGIFQLEYWVDNKLINSFDLSELNYSNMRYLNSHIDYEAYNRNNTKVHKTYIDPGNKLGIYRQSYNNGIFVFDDDKRHKIEIKLYDVYMNASTVEFYVNSTLPIEQPLKDASAFFEFYTDNRFETEDVKLYLPVESIYTDVFFQYKKGIQLKGAYSPLLRVHDRHTPLHKYITLEIKTNGLPKELQDKALIAEYNIHSGKYSSWGGEYSDDGWVKCSTRSFGDVCVVVDTIAPGIRSLSIDNNSLNEKGRIRFKIFDDLSGIKNYVGRLDGKWVLFEYDAKRDLIEYNFDEYIKKGKTHKIELEVLDQKDNRAVYESSFFY